MVGEIPPIAVAGRVLASLRANALENICASRELKAKKLLEYSQKPIYEISEIVGYKNATHFTAAFKKQEGTTPKKFRMAKNIL